MFLSEEQAKKKWCPFAREATLIQNRSNNDAVPVEPVANRWQVKNKGKVENLATKCLASSCMAWREVANTTKKNNLGIDEIHPGGGYCGLAGRPDGKSNSDVRGF